MKPPVPPPWQVQQRAWECAYILKQEHWDALPIEQRVYVEVVYQTYPDDLGWHEVARMLVLYGETADVRV